MVAPPYAAAQSFEFPGAATSDAAALSKLMPGLAREVIAAYKDADRRTYLDNLFRLQIVAGEDAAAGETLAALRTMGPDSGSPQADATRVLYEVFAAAKARASADSSPFDEAFQRSFREVVGRQDDRTAALVMRALGVDLAAVQQTLSGALEPLQGKGSIALPDALSLLNAYLADQAFRSFAPLAAPLIAEDDQRRYLIERDLTVRAADGATVCVAFVVRPRSATGRLPALLNFTIYADPRTLFEEARRTASHGYAGVEGLTRGKGCSPDPPVPYEHDGADAAAVIDWISRRPWSDGRVGMYGGSYEGFTQWAAAKHRPKALRALMPSVTVAPGIDVPMEGNIFQSFSYYWPFYTTSNKTLDNGPYNDRARWWRMNREWYVQGPAYRSLEKIDGTPNPFFARWLDHPSYDAYWQAMIPYGKEFAGIDIPVLTTTGFFDAQIGALYYLIEHNRYCPNAEHYLLIGPYDHIRGQRGTYSRLGNPLSVLRGYTTDPVAQIDLGELRYQWFDFVFKGAPKPLLLRDKVNYEVMGANEWKHAPSLAAMSRERVRFHLSAEKSGDDYRLSRQKPPGDVSIPQEIHLADRSDADAILPGGGIVDKELNRAGSLVFVSDPFPQAIEVSGLFSGKLELVANKKDLDFSVELYEQTDQGEYVELSFLQTRAGYARDRSRRRLLTPGRRETLDIQSGRLTSRRFQPGSRLVAVLRILKSPGAQINYGTGKDVSDETIADGKEPLQIRWFEAGFIEVPVSPAKE
jgi:putative CocE/NonD family hydrolase